MAAVTSISDVKKKIEDAIGDAGVSSDPESVKGFFKNGEAPDAELAVAIPSSTDDLSKIITILNEEEVPAHTLKDPYLSKDQAKAGGVIIDFSKLDKVERIDNKNLAARIQRGVNLSDLKKAADEKGVHPLAPVMEGSGKAVDIFVNRAVWTASCRYPEVGAANMAVVLADGRILKTGSHALNEEMGDNKEDGGPNLTRWFLAGEDSFGIVARASVWLFPNVGKRSALAFGFDDIGSASKAVKEIPRREIGQEYLAMDAGTLEAIFGVKSDKPWAAIIGFGAKDYVVENQEKRVAEFAKSYGGNRIDASSDDLINRMEKPLYNGAGGKLAFFSSYAKLGGLLDKVSKSSKIKNHLLVSFSRGRSAYNVLTLGNGADIDAIAVSLVGEGAFFDRPLGKLADAVYSKNANYFTHMKRIKKFMDPKGILNPGAITSEL